MHASTSRDVECHGKDLYFLDSLRMLYWYEMNKMLDTINNGGKEFKAEVIFTNVDCFCKADNGGNIFVADKFKKVHKYGTTVSLSLPNKERVTAMVARYGLLIIATMTEKNNKKPDDTNKYYIHSQRNLQEVIPGYKKVGDNYLNNMIERIYLHKIAKGLLMVGLPSYHTCDIFLLNKSRCTVLQRDKKLNMLCHWTIAIHQIDDNVRLLLGTTSDIQKIEFKV